MIAPSHLIITQSARKLICDSPLKVDSSIPKTDEVHYHTKIANASVIGFSLIKPSGTGLIELQSSTKYLALNKEIQ